MPQLDLKDWMTFCMIGLKTWHLTSLSGLEAYLLRMNGRMGPPGATPTGAAGSPVAHLSPGSVSTSTSTEARVAGGTRTVPLCIHTSAAPAQSQSVLNDVYINMHIIKSLHWQILVCLHLEMHNLILGYKNQYNFFHNLGTGHSYFLHYTSSNNFNNI